MASDSHEVSPELLAQVQQLELKLLDEFVRVCDKNDIPYTLAYGTALGAVRHKGFIPWDDDVDVFVFAQDLDRLRAAMERDLAEGFFYQCEETEPDFHMTTLRLRLDGTTAIDMDNVDHDVHQGLFIDIYPLYEVSRNPILRLRQQAWAMVNCLLTIHRIPYNHGTLGKVAAKVGFLVFDHPGVKEHARAVMRSCLGKNTGLIANLNSAWISIKKIYKTEWMLPGKGSFEGREVSIPRDSDGFLSERYGDYMALPPEENRKAYHDFVLFDPDTDYRVYKGKYYLVR